MQKIIVLCISALSSYVFADDENVPIRNVAELQDWCRNISARYYINGNQAPYNWSFSQWGEGNYLNAKGNWKVNTSNISVRSKLNKIQCI